MSHTPSDLTYTKDHEWVKENSDGTIRMGITDYAQSALGDIVYIQLPKVGATINANSVCGEVESTKSVSEIFAPVSGKVLRVNEKLEANPELINSDPYGEGWIAELGEVSRPQALLSAQDYSHLTA